eukprot:COSAG01_NODE_8921_length_2613_cov_2.269292_1_plen_54_part_00
MRSGASVTGPRRPLSRTTKLSPARLTSPIRTHGAGMLAGSIIGGNAAWLVLER